MPDLVKGDYVVAIYIEHAENHALNSNGFLSERAFLRDTGLPIFRGRFDVLASQPKGVSFERLNGAPPRAERASLNYLSIR